MKPYIVAFLTILLTFSMIPAGLGDAADSTRHKASAWASIYGLDEDNIKLTRVSHNKNFIRNKNYYSSRYFTGKKQVRQATAWTRTYDAPKELNVETSAGTMKERRNRQSLSRLDYAKSKRKTNYDELEKRTISNKQQKIQSLNLDKGTLSAQRVLTLEVIENPSGYTGTLTPARRKALERRGLLDPNVDTTPKPQAQRVLAEKDTFKEELYKRIQDSDNRKPDKTYAFVSDDEDSKYKYSAWARYTKK